MVNLGFELGWTGLGLGLGGLGTRAWQYILKIRQLDKSKRQNYYRSTLKTQFLTLLKVKANFIYYHYDLTLYLSEILLNSCVSASSQVQDFEYWYFLDQPCVVSAAQINSSSEYYFICITGQRVWSSWKGDVWTVLGLGCQGQALKKINRMCQLGESRVTPALSLLSFCQEDRFFSEWTCLKRGFVTKKLKIWGS